MSSQGGGENGQKSILLHRGQSPNTGVTEGPPRLPVGCGGGRSWRVGREKRKLSDAPWKSVDNQTAKYVVAGGVEDGQMMRGFEYHTEEFALDPGSHEEL